MKNFITFITISIILASNFSAIEVWVWSSKKVSSSYKVLEENENHPCGPTSKIQIKVFPDVTEADEFGMEKVVEYSGSKILNRWVVPIDNYILAISGKSIYLPFKEGALKLSSEMEFDIVKAPAYESKWIKECPKIVLQEFPSSDYVVCHEYKDLKTQKIRRIAYEGPCT